jgi:5-methylthioadenosine/S-adenosylhomocysteine deaminase
MLIRNALVVAKPAEAVPFMGWVKLNGRSIEAVGEGHAPQGTGVTTIDARGRVLIPGLVNSHAHSHSSLTRGSAEGMALEPWLQAGRREQSKLTGEQARVSALATYGEALLSGTTTIMDMCLIPEAARDAALEIGIRAVIAPRVADRMTLAVRLNRAASLIAENEAGGRVRFCVGLDGLENASDELIREGVALAKTHDVPVHLHCAESKAWTEKTRSRTGRSPVAHLEELGALSEKTLLAHCVWVDQHDLALLAARRASVAHCPHSNLKLGSGIAPVGAMRKAGVRVALGTDGAKANNRLDMFDVMKFASLLAKGTSLDPAVLNAREVLSMATAEGAQAVGAQSGEIAPGRPADLVLVAIDRFHLQPVLPSTVVTNLVHAARGSDVDMVIVDGEIVVQDGRLTRVDQDDVLARQAAAGGELLSDS